MTDSPTNNTASAVSIADDQTLRRKIIKMIVLSVTCYALSYLLNMVIGKFTNAEQYGKYGLITNSIVTIGGFLMFGFDVGSEYFISLYSEAQMWQKLRGFFTFMIRFFFYGGIPFVIVSLLFYGTHAFHGDFANLEKTFLILEQSHPFLLYSWIVPLFAVMLVCSSALGSLNGQLANQVISGIFFPCVQLGIIFFFFFVVGHVHVHYAVYAYGVATLLVILLEVFLIKNRLPVAVWKTREQEDPKTWMTYAFPVFLFNSISFGIDTSVLWLLSFFHDQQAYLGYYSAITAISGYFINSAVWSFVSLFDIYVAPLWADKNYVILQKLVNKSFYVLTISSVLFCLYVVIFGKKLLANFGLDYVYAYPALVIYTVSACLNSATLMWTSLLSYTNHVYDSVKSYAFAYLVLVVGVALASIAHMDFEKIMIVYGLFQLVFFLGNAFYIWKKLRPIQLFPGI